MNRSRQTRSTVRKLRDQGLDDREILRRLRTTYDEDEVEFFLESLPPARPWRRFLWLNRLLCVLLLLLTIKKLYDSAMLQLLARSAGQFSPLLFLDLIVPAINFYILSRLVHGHRQGYLFMMVLGLLAFLRPENRVQPDMGLYLAVTLLAGFLYVKLFAARSRPTSRTDSR